MSNTSILQAERDALAILALMARAYELFDVPVEFPGETAPSHVGGLNIHALILDNVDGEVLAIDRNTIHSDGSPLQHGEQRALRAAISRVTVKRQRPASQSIEGYYRTSMFLARGLSPDDFLNLGATLYTTLEPCPYCASALLVTRMKRSCYLIADKKYGGAWNTLKNSYYSSDDTSYSYLGLAASGSKFADAVEVLRAKLILKTDKLRSAGARDTHLLDGCRDELGEAFALLCASKPSDLSSTSLGDARNGFTLASLQRILGMSVS